MSIYPKIPNTTQNYGHEHQRGHQHDSSECAKNRAAHTHQFRHSGRHHHSYHKSGVVSAEMRNKNIFMKNIIILLRPQQWLKNLFIFIPLFFDQKLFDWNYLLPSIIAFLAYCFAASGIYCLNDLVDVESDRKHPKKCKRPIASGAVSKITALALVLLCFSFSLMVSCLLEKSNMLMVAGIIIVYFVMNITYCLKLKQKAIIDVFFIAVGFVLRIFVGGFASNIDLSHWIVLMTFLLALFLAFAKRRDDVVLYEDTGVVARKNVNRYNLPFMNQVIGVISAITMVCYIMYTVSPEVIERMESRYVYLTSVFVLAGIIRYLQLTIVDVKSGSPTKVLMQDRFVQGCIVGWILTFVIILYI